ncbi:MAG: glycogen synthase [Ignavibacteria bacterium]|jgi:starch synthase|nr:glycogen synthase [Ignavibacteria bacterium]
MGKSLKILYVASECYPYAKETGVADVAAALPIALRELGHDIRVIIPKYGCVSERKTKIHDINRLRDIEVDMGNGHSEILIAKSTAIATSKIRVQCYVVTNGRYFENYKGIYHEPTKWTEYPDNLERFMFFSRATLETCIMLGWYPDIIHCNDWQTALIPAYIHYLYPHKFRKTKSVLTIHNISSQGEYPLTDFKTLCLPEDAKDSFTHKKKLNILKGGILYANQVTTVSPSYLEQITKDKDLTNGLNTLLKLNENRIEGIANGIDTAQWNPAFDEFLPHKLSDDVIEFKTLNKKVLCKHCSLQFKEDLPVMGMVTRIDTQKGVDVLVDAMNDLMALDFQLIILGQGDAELKTKLLQCQKKYPKKLSVKLEFNDELSHLIEAGSDMYLMPSRQEGCGLNLLYSMAYGSVPIVNLTGGIKDNAVPMLKEYKDGDNSVAMKSLTPKDLVAAVKRTIEAYHDKEVWYRLIENAINGDYGWQKSALKYDEVYRKTSKDTE